MTARRTACVRATGSDSGGVGAKLVGVSGGGGGEMRGVRGKDKRRNDPVVTGNAGPDNAESARIQRFQVLVGWGRREGQWGRLGLGLGRGCGGCGGGGSCGGGGGVVAPEPLVQIVAPVGVQSGEAERAVQTRGRRAQGQDAGDGAAHCGCGGCGAVGAVRFEVGSAACTATDSPLY